MKSNFRKHKPGRFGANATKLLAVLLGLAGMGWGLLAGCSNRTPFDAGYPGMTPTPNVTPVYPAPTLVPNRRLVANFDSGNPSINPNLMEMNNLTNYTLNSPGSVTLVNNFGTSNGNHAVASAQLTGAPTTISVLLTSNTSGGTTVFNWLQNPLLDGPGANGTPYAFHATGFILDLGNSVFPALDLEAPMEGGGQYDGSFFNGVKFYLMIASDDGTTKKNFAIPTFQTTGNATPGGGCVGGSAAGCYDHYAFDLTSAPKGAWKLYTIAYSQLAQLYAGIKTSPPSFSGANLQQMLWLQWEESLNNTKGQANVDFWVDDIEFYQ